MAANSSSSPAIHFSDHSSSAYGDAIVAAFLLTRLLFLVPVSLLILHLGVQRRRRSSAAASHADVFTYHSAAVDLINAFGTACYVCGQYAGLSAVTVLSSYAFPVVFLGNTSLHILTCVERYLAVVHPVLYLQLKRSGRGLQIRNTSAGCVWLLCVAWMCVAAFYLPASLPAPYLCFILLSLVVVSFCSLSVLRVLLRSGPGETAADRSRGGRSKRRPFLTVVVIMAVLWLFAIGYFVGIVLQTSFKLNYTEKCLVTVLSNMATLPSSLVLPLLFLHRAGKVPCCTS